MYKKLKREFGAKSDKTVFTNIGEYGEAVLSKAVEECVATDKLNVAFNLGSADNATMVAKRLLKARIVKCVGDNMTAYALFQTVQTEGSNIILMFGYDVFCFLKVLHEQSISD